MELTQDRDQRQVVVLAMLNFRGCATRVLLICILDPFIVSIKLYCLILPLFQSLLLYRFI
jgi:hypothetical protein